MFVSYDKKSTNSNWKDHTLIMPCVSVGNVGQLAADLIISSLYMNKVGCFHDDSIIPVIGNDPFASGDLSKTCKIMTAAEVFDNPQHKLVVVQLRSSIVPGKRDQFLIRLQEWIDTCSFSKVVILTSSFSHERRDQQLQGPQMRYVESPDFSKTDSAKFISETLSWPKLESRPLNPAFRETDVVGESSSDSVSDVYISGGGFAKHLLQKCITSHIPALVLLRFCAEGDNIYDAVEMASMLNQWFSWIDIEKPNQPPEGQSGGWRMPSSWRLQYGSGFQQVLFQ